MRLLHRYVTLWSWALGLLALAHPSASCRQTHFDVYSFRFKYSPPINPSDRHDGYRESLQGFLGVDLNDEAKLEGELHLAANDELLYGEWIVKGDVKLQEWRFPSYVVRYYPFIRDLHVDEALHATRDLIPLWLPASYVARRFIRPSADCKQGGSGPCIDEPGFVDRPIRLQKSQQGDEVTLSFPGVDKGTFAVSWVETNKKVRHITVIDGFRTRSPDATWVDRHLRVDYDAITGSFSLIPPNWEDLARVAKAIDMEGAGVVYDPKKGSLWDQRLASIKAWKDYGARKDPPTQAGRSALDFLSSPFFIVGALIVLAGLFKFLFKQLKA